MAQPKEPLGFGPPSNDDPLGLHLSETNPNLNAITSVAQDMECRLGKVRQELEDLLEFLGAPPLPRSPAIADSATRPPVAGMLGQLSLVLNGTQRELNDLQGLVINFARAIRHD